MPQAAVFSRKKNYIIPLCTSNHATEQKDKVKNQQVNKVEHQAAKGSTFFFKVSWKTKTQSKESEETTFLMEANVDVTVSMVWRCG